MKKTILLLSLCFAGLSFSANAATQATTNDEDQLDESIRLPIRRLHQQQLPQDQQVLLASSAKKDKKNKKNQLSQEELDRIAAEKAAKEAEEAKRKAEIEALLNEDYTIVQYVQPDPEPYKWEENEDIEATKDELLPLFQTGKANSTGGDTEYILKDINSSVKANDFYFYFNTTNGVPEPLRFVAHYYADDGIKMVKLRFTIDGFKYEFQPTNIYYGRDGKFYVENFDNAFDANSRDVAAALSHCAYANMVLVSDGGVNHRIFFTPEQLQHFRQTVQLYRLMGGKL